MEARSAFAYRAVDASGRVVTGSISAASEAEVSRRVRAEGKIVLEVIRDLPGMAGRERQVRESSAGDRRVRRSELVGFCRQMGVMLETGVPVSEALDAVAVRAGSPEFKGLLAGVSAEVHAGSALSASFARRPRAFPTIVISLIRAAEASGSLGLMFGRVGDYLAREEQTRRRVKGALTYPAIMLGAGILIVGGLIAFVLPRFAAIYAGKGATLPLPTRMLLGASDALVHGWMTWVPVLAAVLVGGFLWRRSVAGRRSLDRAALVSPIVGGLNRQAFLARSFRTLATLLAGGVHLLDALSIARALTDNSRLHLFWDRLEKAVRDGRQLSDAMSDDGLVPADVTAMVAAAERSGRLPQTLERISAFTDEELDSEVKRVTAMIEPLTILLLGAAVGGIALAVLLPMFKVGSVVAK
jgi:type IV pilus assembly protein PilC